MKTTLRFIRIVCLAACLFVFPSNAPAAVTKYLTLTGLDFHPTTSDLKYSSMNGGIYATALVGGFGFYAAYHLPSGSSVTGIEFFYVDNSSEENILFDAHRYTPSTNSNYTISSTATTGASGSIRSISLSSGLPFTIANSINAYRLRVEFNATGTSQILYGARITYTLPEEPPSADYVTMAGADLRSSSSNMTYAALGGTLYATAIETTHYFHKRLDLPQGATITRVDWYVIDNHEGNFNLRLYSHRPENDYFFVETSSQTSGDDPSPNVRIITKTGSITIDNSIRSYSVFFAPTAASSDLRIVGARVHYTLPANPDLQAKVKTFSGVHFYPSGSSLTYKALGMKLYALALSSGRSFQAGLNLPSGVRIDKITFYFTDDSAKDISFAWREYRPSSGNYDDRAIGSSSGASGSIRTVTLSDISTLTNTYDLAFRLRAELGEAANTMLLVGAKVYEIEEEFPWALFLPAMTHRK